MSGYVKMGLLIGGAIIAATAMWIYFSPLQTCIRAAVANGNSQTVAEGYCAGRVSK
jgi:hypothetical protein